jgi:hypothetical protein
MISYDAIAATCVTHILIRCTYIRYAVGYRSDHTPCLRLLELTLALPLKREAADVVIKVYLLLHL